MSVTATGIVIIILGLLLFITSTKWLIGLMVFFVPFTGTAVINVGSGTTGSAIQPFMFLLILVYIKNFIKWSFSDSKLKFEVSVYQKKFHLYFSLFSLALCFSLIMPTIISGSLYGNISGRLGESLPIVFFGRNITQTLYYFLGVLFAYTVFNYAKNTDGFLFLIKVMGYSTFFAVMWGMLELICIKTGLPYPTALFNNNINEAIARGESVLDSGSRRITSIAAEPSILAQSLVIYVPFLLSSIESKTYIFSALKDRLLLLLICLAIFLTTSSSGIISLALVFVIFYLSKHESIRVKAIKIIFQIGLIICGVVMGYILFPKLFEELFLNKSQSYSAAERLGTITSGWDNFLHYPVLGVGWGAITVNDLFLKILSNTGIIGFSLFSMSLYFILKQHLKAYAVIRDNLTAFFVNRSTFLALSLLLLNCEIAGFSFYFGTFWLILGLSIVDKTKLFNIHAPYLSDNVYEYVSERKNL
ncbi:O-antigen ligase family protein [Mucilaginibacter terrae]|uniref:Uncharacterized membrane protein YciS (DUF1049 family) n=1 Tax=Mucilaginibacter terrae TaxID=1955052 RepID=A0ABU3GPQ4_9SPHI|nr:O-antigen ligase family protein [Mucilaginibacter terrae]MDT3401762.1 uncharacterized membrane protein YciS (DUF1049 family) [Mucilaginibacter terrae]